MTPAPRKVYIETYGCQMNVADSELMAGTLADAGYATTNELDDADVILVNTCAVRENAEQRVYGRASQLLPYKRRRDGVVLGIAGCMAEHLREKIVERAPYIDLVIGPDAYRRLPNLLDRLHEGETDDPLIDVRLDKRETYEGVTPRREGGVSGFVTIQRGCDKFCTFCIVPFTRGRERGTPPREILRQVRQLAADGCKEVTLLGQTVNSYRYEDVDFSDLLHSVCAVDGIERVRYTSPYPVDFTSRLIDTLAELDKVQPYLHLPVQSGSDDVLARMKRGYTIGDFHRIVDELRDKIPEIAISTDVIVGFPGESDANYEATLRLMQQVRFDFAYMFAYSEREGTYASKRIPDEIPEERKKARLRRLIELQESINRERYGRHVGSTVEVLCEGPSKRGNEQWYGKSADFKTTVFDEVPGMQAGSIVNVLVEDASSHSLFGRVVARVPSGIDLTGSRAALA